MTRTGILGTIAAALLLASMFAPLFGAVGKWGPRLSCSECGYEGEWPGTKCPRCGK